MNIFFAFIIISVMGLLLGVGLAFAARKLAVAKNQKQIDIEAVLPGANCGGCGYPGCAAYAEACANDECALDLCAPGGNDVILKMGEILGKSVETSSVRKVAYVFCDGDVDKTKTDFEYEGIRDCNAAALLFDGEYSCKEGCLQLGSCIEVCPVDAISQKENGHIEVDPKLCISCGKCVDICPHNVIKLVDEKSEYAVKCNNHDAGGKVRKICEVGCIGCRICVRKFPESGCSMDGFLAVFDNSKPHSQIEEAANSCPQKCIVKRN